MPSESRRGRAVVGRARGARPGAAGQVRRQVELPDVRGAELGREAGLLVGVDDDGVDPARRASMSCRSPGWPSCGSTLCAMSTVRGPRPGRAVVRADTGGAQEREVGGHDGGDDVDDDDDVDVAQPAAGAHPGVGARPGQHAQGAREGVDVGPAAGHRLLARVERRRVEVAPRHEGDLVPGIGELVRERRRVGGDPALVGVGGPDERDLERGAEPATASRTRRSGPPELCQTPSLDLTTRSESSARLAIMMPLTMSSTVLAGK